MRLPASLFLTALAGCTWVSSDDIDARRGELDDDQDGFIASDDCNDEDAGISPGATEIWYDGIDGDCAGDDDFDADADGYVMDDYLGYQTNGVDGSGELPGGDCNEADPNSNPGFEETWYDGVDSDCGGEDDYDQDGDGFVDDAYEGMSTTNVEDSGALASGDCDDLAADINPSIEDFWYDGVDTDCGGEDDFDADQDGHAADNVLYTETTYVEGSGQLVADDCNEVDATINPGQDETWYDGVDSDCGLDDDFDADADGYIDQIHQGWVTDGLCQWVNPKTSESGETETSCLTVLDCEDDSGLEWSCVGLEGSGELPTGECDDADPDSNPGEIEVLSDAIDRDCDGNAASLALTDIVGFSTNLDSFDWANPYRPRFASNTTTVYLSVVMESGSYVKSTGSSSNFYDSAVAFSLSTEDLTSGVTDLLEWQRIHQDSDVYYLSGGHDFIATDDAVYGATSLQWFSGTTRGILLTRYDLGSSSRAPILYSYYAGLGVGLAEFEDLNIAIDQEDGLHVLACESEDGLAQYARGTLDSIESQSFDLEAEVEGVALSTCDLHFDADPIGLVYGAQAGTDGECHADGVATGISCLDVSECEDSSGVVWTCSGALDEGMSSYSFNRNMVSPGFNSLTNTSSYLPEQLVMVESDAGTRVVFIDPFLAALVIIEPDGEEWVEDLGGAIPTSIHAVRDETVDTDELVVSMVTEDGEILLMWGSPDVGFTSYTLTPSFTPLEAAAWLDPDGAMVLIAATSIDQLNFGMAWR